MRIDILPLSARLAAPLRDRSGAATTDYVVLTATVVLLSIGAIGGVSKHLRETAGAAATRAEAAVDTLR